MGHSGSGWATVRVWQGSARAGRCKHCKRPFMWMMTEAGRMLPFDLGFTVRELVTDPRNGRRYAVLDRGDLHDCPKRKQFANKRSHPGKKS